MYYWPIASTEEIHHRLRMAGWCQIRTSTILNGSATITLGVPYLVPYKTESIQWHHYLLDLSKYMAYTTVFTGLSDFNFVDSYGR